MLPQTSDTIRLSVIFIYKTSANTIGGNTPKMHVFFFREDQNSKHSKEAKILLNNDSIGSHKRLFQLGVNFTLLSFSSACVICDPWLISNSTKREEKKFKNRTQMST